MNTLRILSGGAAQGLVGGLGGDLMAASGLGIAGSFGAVGAMRDKLVAGEPVDIVILTRALIAELTRQGHVVPGSAVDLGVVRTAIAVRSGDPMPDISDAAALARALGAADAIYFPDPKLATAGIHFARVLDTLGLSGALARRLRPYPNGAAAMAALGLHVGGAPIGCTQVTEIRNTPGVRLVANLPQQFELATVYTAAVAGNAERPDAARRFAAMMTAESMRAARTALGFEAA